MAARGVYHDMVQRQMAATEQLSGFPA